jgi:AcrR family transcriptional regulator
VLLGESWRAGLTVRSVKRTLDSRVVTTQAEAASGRARVDAILRAACRVVVEDGAHDLHMATVARQAGVSKALVHYYFSTRQELLRAAFVFAEEERERALEAALGTLPSGRERVEHALVHAIEPAGDDSPALWNEVWSSLRSDPELRPLVQQHYRGWAERIVRLLEEGQADGSVPREVSADEAGWRLAAMADGLESILYLDLCDLERARRLLLSALELELAP